MRSVTGDIFLLEPTCPHDVLTDSQAWFFEALSLASSLSLALALSLSMLFSIFFYFCLSIYLSTIIYLSCAQQAEVLRARVWFRVGLFRALAVHP